LKLLFMRTASMQVQLFKNWYGSTIGDEPNLRQLIRTVIGLCSKQDL
jgi:hypothetical protein